MDKLELTKGQIILLELEGECVIGEILHIGSNKTFVRLKDVRDFQSNVPIPGNQDYYNSEIRSIKIIKESKSTQQDDGNENTSTTLSSAESVVARINLEDIQQIFDRIDDHVFIFQTDIKYHDAIRYLKTQKLIAIGMEGTDAGRQSSAPSILSIATPDRIYLFDIMWMNVTKDLRAILADPKVRRVLHNGRLMQDVLEHRFQAPLGKYFDTLVAHISTTNDYDDQTELSIQQCLSKYLNFPSNFFDSSITFSSRPLIDKQRKAAAKNVAFLITLQDYLLHEIMLETFYRSCHQYGSSLSSHADHIMSVIKLSKARNEDINEIERFRLNIRADHDETENDEERTDQTNSK